MKMLALLAALVAAAVLPGAASGAGSIVRAHEGLPDKDYRTGTVKATAAQKAAASSLGATSVRWNRFGTVQSMFKRGGFLATGLAGNPVEVARAFVARNAVLFRLGSADGLETLNAVRLGKTKSFVVTFRQRFGDVAAAHEGLITVAVKGDKVVYVSSSSVGTRGAPAAPTLSAAEAWVRAAANVRRNVSIVDLKDVQELNGWTQFTVNGFHQVQQARLGALALPSGGVRPVWEANVVDVHDGHTDGYTVLVDAVTGAALLRDNRVDLLESPNPPTVNPPKIVIPIAPTVTAPSTNVTVPGVSLPQVGAITAPTAGASENVVSTSALAGGPFSGSYTATTCGPLHEFTVADAKSIVVTAAAPGNDIILHLFTPSGEDVVSDIPLGPNPEVIQYEPSTLVPGTYKVQVCPFDEAQIPPMEYAGTFTATGVSLNPTAQPRWRMFTSNPPLSYATTDTRVLGCWEAVVNRVPVPGCQLDLFAMAPHPMPWDVSPRTLQPTFTTRGNNAHSAEAWAAPPAPKVGTITPAEQYSPVSPSRDYSFSWTNQWQEAKCSPQALASAARNDIDTAAANLFAMHNRMHDWSYFLGFTERTYNLQETNFGATAATKENDPEIGDVQSGGLTGGPPQFLGRDNANQLTLQDGVVPITNMYLWQPIAGGFYAPCVDGDYDMSVIGHEYTHAISNRMVAGPDAGLTGDQSRAMGESWSDLVAVEYLAEYGYVPEGLDNPFVVGAYATGNKVTGIRNYAMNASPLNYSDVGYDFVCNTDIVTDACTGITQVHADGEIWSAANFDLRQALVAKYDGAFPSGDRSLQERCGNGDLPAEMCPGNRRWIQIVFDAFLLQQAETSMLDARDAYLAADVLRFGGANQADLWNVFARRGMGETAVSRTADDFEPVPSFISPHSAEGAVTFQAVDETGAAVPATFFVGRYEARVTPIADTDSATELDAAAAFVPGTYEFVVRAKGYGLQRVAPRAIAAEPTTITVTLKRNWASTHKGATVTGEGLSLTHLIDDTEGTNWAVVGKQPSVAGASVVVDLAGGARTVNSVRVSALLRPRDFENEDSAGQNRFTALRQFEIWTCNSDLEADRNCTTADDFKRIFVSPADAFPTAKPRPLAPNLLLRSFDVPNTLATHVKLVVRTNQCLGNPDFRGDQDADALNDTDCVTGSTRDNDVRAAELQVFS